MSAGSHDARGFTPGGNRGPQFDPFAGRREVEALLPLEQGAAAPEDPWTLAKHSFMGNKLAVLSVFVMIGVVLLVLATPLMENTWADRSHSEPNLSGTVAQGGADVEVVNLQGVPQVGPGIRTEYTMGADQLGRDVFMRILEGGKVSLTVGFSAAIITTILAVILGTMAGFFKGRMDMVISRYFDIQWAFPTLLLAISLSTALAGSEGFLFIKRGSPALLVMIMGFVMIPYLGRMIRSQVLSISSREYVEASISMGATSWRTMMREIVPNVIPVVITYFGLLVSMNILFEAGLSFLGVGVQPPTPSWGNIIADGRIYYSSAWWIAFFPGMVVALVVLCLNLIGEALEEAFDPKAAGR